MKLNTFLMTSTVTVLVAGTAFAMTGPAMMTGSALGVGDQAAMTDVDGDAYDLARNRERGRNGCECDVLPDRDQDGLQIGIYQLAGDETRTQDQLQDGTCTDDEPDQDRLRIGYPN